MPEPIDITISQDGKQDQSVSLPGGVYTIGSDDDNKIVLADSMISWRHCILTNGSDGLSIEDLGSSTGTYLEGQRVTGRQLVGPGQRVQVGTFVILRNGNGHPAAPPPSASATSAPQPPHQSPQPPQPPRAQAQAPLPMSPSGASPRASAAPVAPHPNSPPPGAAPPQMYTSPLRNSTEPRNQDKTLRAREKISPVDPRKTQIKKQVHTELLKRLDMKRMTVNQASEDELQQRARHLVAQIISEVTDKLPEGIHPTILAKEICEEALQLGPLEDLLADESVTEIMVNGPNRIYVEQGGKLQLTPRAFINDDSVLAIIERIVSPIGRRIDESQPYVDARLADGSRVNAVIPPLSLSGPCITIRKFSKDPFTVQDLIGFGSLTQEIADFIAACTQLRKNIIVSGGTGTGKTTLLNVVSNYLPSDERIVTIEDAAELRLIQDHVITLEARPANMEGKGAITIRDLVRNSLRMRPDRIVVGECRGGEALDMLQAMNTGHDGSLTTIHANTPRDVISRLETMVLMSGMDLPVRAIREQIGSAVQLILQLTRFSDGTRRVSKVTEVCGMEGDKITMQDLWDFKQVGIDENKRVLGRVRPTGSVPTFMEEFDARGISIDKTMFNPDNQSSNGFA